MSDSVTHNERMGGIFVRLGEKTEDKAVVLTVGKGSKAASRVPG